VYADDAGELAEREDAPVDWAVPDVVGGGVLSLLSAPPGCGKGWWTWGLLRAMQDGGTFYGLRVSRLARARPWWRRWGKGRPGRVLWLTEEGGQSFARTARRFGIRPGLVTVLRRDQAPAVPWPELVRRIWLDAWRKGCAVVIVDTVRAWCPQAEKSPEAANEVMQAVRQELAEPGLAVLVVHRDRKGGGDFGEGVSGTNALVGAVDVLIEPERVGGRVDDPRRRMVTSRRFEPMDVTARLEGHRYVVDGNAAGTGIEDSDALGTKPILSASTPAATTAPSPPVDGEAYRQYLQSERWAARRGRILPRAGDRCERCGGGAPAEVHHPTYERLGAERDGDPVALCAPCHRGAHPPRVPRSGAPLPPHVRRTLARPEQLDREIETDEPLRLEAGSEPALLARLRALEGAGLVAGRGRGVRGDPQRWRATAGSATRPSGGGARSGRPAARSRTCR
jgi:hypothetical protein